MGKFGFPSYENPQSVFPSIVGPPKSVQAIAGGQNNDTHIGREAYPKARILILKASIGRGIVTN
jgi:actin-related protein